MVLVWRTLAEDKFQVGTFRAELLKKRSANSVHTHYENGGHHMYMTHTRTQYAGGVERAWFQPGKVYGERCPGLPALQPARLHVR